MRIRPAAIIAVSLALSAIGHATPRAEAAPQAHKPLTAEAVTRAVSAIFRRHSDHSARLAEVSALFLGARYQLSPLGEGERGGPDPDPIVRYDAFDCVTYVEQVMALSWQPSHREGSQALQQIRYHRGKIDYAQRNHIMMAQWIPHNLAAGFVRDISVQIAKKQVKTAQLRLHHAAYESNAGRALKLARDERPLGSYFLPIVPRRLMPKLVDRVPHGTIITTIRSARSQLPYRASHVGLVVVRDGQRWIRHAHAPSGRVVEQPLRAFIARAQTPRKWPIVGFNLLAITPKPTPSAKDAAARRSHR